MASDEEFSFIYNDVAPNTLCGPLQPEEPAVMMLSPQHHHQQQYTGIGALQSSSGSTFPPSTNDDNEKRTTNGETSSEIYWASSEIAPTSRSRTSPLSNPARRAEHNATERARRESLNGKFRLLASILPNLQNSKKPSKSQIIEKALEWVEHSLLSEERYHFELLRLEQENKKIGHQLQNCLASSQQWQLNTPPNDAGFNYSYAVPSPPSSTATLTSSPTYSCGNRNVTPAMVTPSITAVDVPLINQQQQYHHST
ncbi:hypothetical protein BJV82DRAFT_34527 [Fennellomyces sp. T-0311]|nr:hypothetical protein BJV82DRAFT_34527 [Fennellomyces sp. T-0311]